MSAGDFLKTIGKVAFPFISTAATAGGPLGVMAAQAVGRALHIDKQDPAPEAIANVMAAAMGDPAQRQALVEEEHKFQLDMAALQIKDVEALEQIAASDRQNARAREVAVRDKTPEIGFYLLLLIFVLSLYWVISHPVPDANKAIVFSMIGSEGTLVVMAATYFYGTTRESGRKTELIAQAPAVNGNGK